MVSEKPIVIATRGSALALVQANLIAAQGRVAFPQLRFELKIIKTTGDKMQTASLANVGGALPRGLFTKELEAALLDGEADLAVHSLKDLPTDLPDGLMLAATPERADVRDVLIYRAEDSTARGFKPHTMLKDFPDGATIATSSTRRKMSLLAARPDLKIVEMRGNVPTRLQKVSERGELDATILALAGLTRLGFEIEERGQLVREFSGDTRTGRPRSDDAGLLATVLSLGEMLPCVGQGAIGIETRAGDGRIANIVARLNHADTFFCVTAERAFLQAMGGGCQSPVGAHAEISGGEIFLKAISFRDETVKRGEGRRRAAEAVELGKQVAAALK